MPTGNDSTSAFSVREELRQHPLRVGLSTTATVDTHDRSGTVLAAAPSASDAAVTRVYTTDLTEADRAADRIVAANLQGAGAH